MILVIGDAGWDISVLSPVPAGGHTVVAPQLRFAPAGGSANAAAWAAHSGKMVVLAAQVGQDDLAASFERECAAFPSLQLQLQASAQATQVSTIMIDPATRERTVLVSRADGSLRKTSAMMDQARSASVVLLNVESDHLRHEVGRAAAGVRVLPLSHALRETRTPAFPWEVIVGSSGDHDPPSWSDLRRLGTSLAVITEGAAGGRFWTPDRGWIRYQAESAGKEVDAGGAGDAFLGGLLCALDDGAEAEVAVKRGALLGARAVAQVGSWPLESVAKSRFSV